MFLNYQLIKDLIAAVERFENENNADIYSPTFEGFCSWLSADGDEIAQPLQQPDWEGKATGRSSESVIATLLVHMNRYARAYSRAAIYDSEFSTQDDFSYLINLQAFGEMTKMQLIKKNVHDKPTGMQIINRLAAKGWIKQTDSKEDKRSKVIFISEGGKKALQRQMPTIKLATRIVSADLTETEKIQLIAILTKLEKFHNPIFQENLSGEALLNTINTRYKLIENGIDFT